MGDPAVEVKAEDETVANKVKLESNEPVAKNVQVDADEPVAKKVKLESDADKGDDKPSEPATGNGTGEVKDLEKVNDAKPEVKKEDTNANGVQETDEDRKDPDLEANIVHQVEYYFGNVNLPKDKFLQEQIKLDDGWVPLDVMLRFQRLAHLSRKPETIATCLKNSSQLMEVSEDGIKIRRSPSKPLPEMNEQWQKELNERTVYCKGFPKTEVNMNTYIKFFRPYGPVENIHLRKYLEKPTQQYKYKGSVYVLFETKDLAEKFLALDSVKYEDTELVRMTQAAHSDEKKKEKDERWGKKVKKNNADEDKGKPKREFAKGCILRITGFKDGDVRREVIKAALVELGADVAFIQFSQGEKEALVRLQSPEDGAATQFMKKVEDSGKKVKLGEEEVDLKLVDGEEEEKFLQRTREYMDRSNKGHKGHRGRQNNRGGHRGGFNRGHKRGRSPNRDGPPAKKEVSS